MEKLNDLAEFLDEQMFRIKRGFSGDLITNEIKKELSKVMNTHNFECEPFSGGNAVIHLSNYKCEILSYTAVLNGVIKYVVEKHSDNPNDTIISEDGYFDGCAYVNNKETILFEQEILITL